MESARQQSRREMIDFVNSTEAKTETQNSGRQQSPINEEGFTAEMCFSPLQPTLEESIELSHHTGMPYPYNPARARKVFRPLEWTAEVENQFRFQKAGFRDEVHHWMVFGTESEWEWRLAFTYIVQKKGDTENLAMATRGWSWLIITGIRLTAWQVKLNGRAKRNTSGSRVRQNRGAWSMVTQNS